MAGLAQAAQAAANPGDHPGLCFATAHGHPTAAWADGWRGVSRSSPGAGVGLPNVSANEPGVKHGSSSATDLASCSQLGS